MPLNLVVQTAFLGDLLLSIPLLKKCRALWPHHKLAIVCRKGLGDLFTKTKLVDEVFEIEKGQSQSYRNILHHLNGIEIDHLIAPHESLRTAFFCSQIRCHHKISFDKRWNFLFFSQRTVKNKNFPDALRQLSLLSAQDSKLKSQLENFTKTERPFETDSMGHLSPVPDWASMSLRQKIIDDRECYLDLRKKIDLDGFIEGKVILIFPGSVWATKRWTAEGFVDIGNALSAKGFRVYVMGGPGEEVLASHVASRISGAVSLAGQTTISESAQLIARAALVIGNDSASTHLAAVCETPVIAIFGPTVLEFGFRPWSSQSFVVQNKNLSCRPCGKHGHQACPIKTHECMRSVSAEEVLRTASFILRL